MLSCSRILGAWTRTCHRALGAFPEVRAYTEVRTAMEVRKCAEVRAFVKVRALSGVGAFAGAGLLLGCGTDSEKKPLEPVEDTSVSESVRTGQEAVITHPDGVAISVFDGTVPTDPAGNPGELVFSIEPSPVQVAAPPGFTSAGPVWQLGPEGLNFAERCRVTMQVADVTKIYALGRFDPVSSRWQLVPAVLGTESASRVSADVKHLSIWTLFQSTAALTNPRAYGAIHVENVDGTRAVSLCIKSYTLSYPDTDANFDPRAAGCILAEAGHNGGAFGLRSEANLVLPQGVYVFEATRTQPVTSLSSVWADGWVELEPVAVISPWVFGSSAPELVLHPSTWQNVSSTPLFAPCEGEADYAFGTGQVQVTLSWDDAVDLDLHVIEPSGEEIYYLHSVSTTGGRLDRDRTCSYTSKSPENIFWGSTGAPQGTYTVNVHLYSLCNLGGGSIPFRLRTVVDGVARTFSGSVISGETKTVTTFNR